MKKTDKKFIFHLVFTILSILVMFVNDTKIVGFIGLISFAHNCIMSIIYIDEDD